MNDQKQKTSITPAGAASASTDALGISLALLWQPVPETLPPDPHGGWFSPLVWLALSDGRVLTGQALHKSADAEYDAPVHDWCAIDPEDGSSNMLSCFGDDLSVVAWMPLAVPDHPRTANGRMLIPNAIGNGRAGIIGTSR